MTYIERMSDTSSHRLRLASWNIRAGLGTDLRRDALRAISGISALKADIVALQEADFRMGRRPTALPKESLIDHTGLCPVQLAENDVSLGWHGVAVLAKPHIKAVDIHRLPLPGLEPRGASVVDFDIGLRVVAVHLGLLRRDRRAQLGHIREYLDDLEWMPTVMMGDFNEWHHSKGFERLDGFTVLAPGGRTYPSRLPVAPLDRFAHNDCCTVHPLPVPRSPSGPKASDHLPILVEVEIHNKAGHAQMPPEERVTPSHLA